jgi:hypothetical protein
MHRSTAWSSASATSPHSLSSAAFITVTAESNFRYTQAYGWQQAPRYIIRDRDRAYGHAFLRRLRAMGIRDRPIAPRSPGRTDVQSGSSDRSDGIALTMSSCLASAISGICSNRTKNITTRRARTYHYRRTRRSPRRAGRRSEVCPVPSWVGYITNISEREFPTGTRAISPVRPL